MILVMKEELMKKDMITEESFVEALLLAQSAPGALAVNMSIAVAQKIAGIPGAILGFFGVILPSFLVILILSGIFSQIRDNAYVQKFMNGTKPAVLALITASFWSLYKAYDKDMIGILLILITILLTVFLDLHPILVILFAGLFYPLLHSIEKFKYNVRNN